MPLKAFSSAEQSTFLRLLLDSTVEAFYSVDKEGNTTLCNAVFLRMLGYGNASEVIGRKLHQEIHHTRPDGTPYPVEACPIYQAASSGKAQFVPLEIFFRKDGTSFPVEYSAQPIIHEGVLQGALCTFKDITGRLAREEALKEQREFTASIVESSPDCIKVLDLEGRLMSMNANGCKQMEVEDVTLCINQDWKEFWQGEDRAKAENSFNEARQGKLSRFEGFCPTTKGTPKWWEVIITPIHGSDGSVKRILAISRDITERRNHQEHMRELQEHLSLMVESATDYAIISMDATGTILTWNPGAERIFGYSPEEVIRKYIGLIFTPEDREYGAPEHELSSASKKGRALDERWHIRVNGERFYVSGTMAAMYDAQGHVKGFIKIARDMTAQQHAQQELLEARNAAEAANMAKTEFLANMSHEIRTPMNAIIGLSNILATSQPLTMKQRDFIRTLQLSADSLLSLINDLLDIAKIEARTVELEHIPFSVTEIVQAVVSMMATRVKEKGLRFTGEGECVQRRMFMGDPTRLRQIILNLCSNAIKFTDAGHVHVSITCHPTGNDRVVDVCIAVSDTGIGIAHDKLDTIFQKFMQADTSINRKYGGTGLGLAITKTLVEIMGGSIRVESTPGRGSTFAVWVPLEIATQENVVQANNSIASIIESAIEKKMKARILLVEDYEPNVMVATTFLEQFGYMTDVAYNGVEAFEKIKTAAYAAVLMDVQMHGMNGFETTQLIREYEMKNNLPRIPIIGMTAHALAGDRNRCIAAGMDDYISKPFNPDMLEQLLQNVVNQSSPA